MDPCTPTGKMIFTVLGAVAEFGAKLDCRTGPGWVAQCAIKGAEAGPSAPTGHRFPNQHTASSRTPDGGDRRATWYFGGYRVPSCESGPGLGRRSPCPNQPQPSVVVNEMRVPSGYVNVAPILSARLSRWTTSEGITTGISRITARNIVATSLGRRTAILSTAGRSIVTTASWQNSVATDWGATGAIK
jgi:hypothetical protein